MKQIIYISDEYSNLMKKYICGEKLQGMDGLISITAKFADGFSMDIRCCGTEVDSFTEAILYDNNGKQVAFTEPCDTFAGFWEMKDDITGKIYQVDIIEIPHLWR